MPRIFCPELDPTALSLLRDKLRAHPERFVAQEYVPLSSAPVLMGNRIEPRPTVLRSFLVDEEDGHETGTRPFLQEFLQQVGERLANLSNALTALYFPHDEQPHILLSRYASHEP